MGELPIRRISRWVVIVKVDHFSTKFTHCTFYTNLHIFLWQKTNKNQCCIFYDKLNFHYPSIRKRTLVAFSCLGMLMVVVRNTDVQQPRVSMDSVQFTPESETVRHDRPVTVVTAYYDIPSKRNNATYIRWITLFLAQIPCHLYIFTDQEHYRRLRFLRKDFKNQTKIVIRPFRALRMAQR